MACGNCKLCQGPLASTTAVPKSPAMQNSASRQGAPLPQHVECHPNCILFACPGCVARDRPTYCILNLSNHVYDYHCAMCMAEIPIVPVVTHIIGAGVAVHAPAIF
ncbi:hypothetical protein TREMEDRAFT_74529 [Tremella mesenterica DSM 1558]|uniref:uncharacterized protein n=1 Tax=Tremella mesenterica (strain ATCC 24925 / CBS 8224 / DSM 1558 / NBRC 9311 / NRRL Y-6157 / RJB 2259-6 / UBC 559-6) TaxID=578456 RepID=UPI0003F499E1|nr:uncharacterized protein TREMEDRAFT_74529 [Tremella mesenterica DSM 1558]EIW67266.1 hypothetical protein TREMEDRAFT_74529 [Tremella mesenterica DSM 1558]